MQQWDMDVILPSRRLMRLQWCKWRQIAPPKKETGKWCWQQGHSTGEGLEIGPFTFLLGQKLQQINDLWCWCLRSVEDVGNLAPENVSWTFSLKRVQRCGSWHWDFEDSAAAGNQLWERRESWVCTNLLTVSNRVVHSFPAKPLILSSCWRTPVPSQKPSRLPSLP